VSPCSSVSAAKCGSGTRLACTPGSARSSCNRSALRWFGIHRVGCCKRYYWLCISRTITRLTPGSLRIKATTNVAAANHATRLEARSTRNCITSLHKARLDTSRSNWVCRSAGISSSDTAGSNRSFASRAIAPGSVLCSVQCLLWRFVRARRSSVFLQCRLHPLVN